MYLLTNPIFLGVVLGSLVGIGLIIKMPIGGLSYYERAKKTITQLRFVSQDTIENELQDEGIVLDQHSKCSVCGTIITPLNFGAVRKGDGGQIFVCTKPRCMTLGKIVSNK